MKDKNLAVPPSTLALHTYLKLVVELGHNEESPPAPQLLRLKHVSEDVVAHIQNISAKSEWWIRNLGDGAPALGPNQLGENLGAAATVHCRVLQGASVRPNAQASGFFVHLTTMS